MTTIDRIGDVNIVRHGRVLFVLDRSGGDIEMFTSYHDARERALERADLVDGLAAIVGETRH